MGESNRSYPLQTPAVKPPKITWGKDVKPLFIFLSALGSVGLLLDRYGYQVAIYFGIAVPWVLGGIKKIWASMPVFVALYLFAEYREERRMEYKSISVKMDRISDLFEGHLKTDKK